MVRVFGALRQGYLILGVITVFIGLFFLGVSNQFDVGAQFTENVPLSLDATNAKVAYQRGGRATSDIYTITPGTGISTGIRRGFHPAYSPDGTKIAFTDNSTANGFLMIMNADGTNARQLATPRQGFTPTWSPDGSRLAFVRGDFESVGDNGKGQLYVIDMTPGGEGANEVLIPTTQQISKPSWSFTNRIAAACYTPRPGGGIDPLGVCVTTTIPPSSQIGSNPPSISLVSGTNTNDRDVTWSPDGTKIGFISTRDYPMASASEIYTMNPDGSAATRLTNVDNFKVQPTWSPDGTRIAFSRGITPTANLSSVLVDGSNGTNPTVITLSGSGDVFPNWGAAPTPTPAAGNGRIAFEAFSNTAGVTQIYTIADSAGASPVLCGAGETREGRRPAYSHDGTKLAFMRNGTIWTANADCTNQVSTGSSGDAPTWSPDGTKIAFARGGTFTDIWTMNADGTGQTKLTDIATETRPTGSFGNGQPSWGSNNKIVFRGTVRKIINGSTVSAGDIWTMDATGTTFTRLTDDPVSAYAPDWSPDSSKIVFASNRATNRGEIYTMNADGTSPTRITNDASISNTNPAWSPDGTKIVHNDDFSRITRRDTSGSNAAVLTLGEFPDWQLAAATPTPTPATPTPTPVTPTPTPVLDRHVFTFARTGKPGDPLSMSVGFRGLGNETAWSFTINFDPAKLTDVSASLGPIVRSRGGQLSLNTTQLSSGKLGVLIEMDAPINSMSTIALVVISGRIPDYAAPGTSPVSFGNSPTIQSVSDLSGQIFPASYESGSISVLPGCAITVNPTSRDFDPAGGTITVAVTQAPGVFCRWRATVEPSTQPFITLGGTTQNSGNGTFQITVGQNGATGRSGNVEVVNDAGIRLSIAITQRGNQSSCTYGMYQARDIDALYPLTLLNGAGGTYTGFVLTQPGCPWTISKTGDWVSAPSPASGVGEGQFTYQASPHPLYPSEMSLDNPRMAAFTIPDSAGSIFLLQTSMRQSSFADCPAGRLLDPEIDVAMGSARTATPDESRGRMDELRGFRDVVLSRTSFGREYTNDYYEYAGEIIRTMIFNPGLMFRSREALDRYRPVVRAMIEKEKAQVRATLLTGSRPTEKTIVYDAEMEEVETLITDFMPHASDSLRQKLDKLRSDIRSSQVQEELGIRVVPGAKRPLPEQHWSFSGLLDQIVSPITAFSHVPQTMVDNKVPQGKVADSKDHSLESLYGKIPMSFEANRGQLDPKVKYLARGAGYSLQVSSEELAISLNKGDNKSNSASGRDKVSMKLDGSNRSRRLRPRDKMATRTNYFVGREKSKWRTDVPNYAKVEIKNVYKGVDLVYYGNQRQLEYDFVVAPGVDPKVIKMDFSGADSIALSDNGDLILGVGGREVQLRAPVTYQESGGIRKEIGSRYELHATNGPLPKVGFIIDRYDKKKPLVIDPVLVYSTYFGGNGSEQASAITVDAAGNAYITGLTDSTNFPLVGAVQSSYGGDPQDIFVSKIDPSGTGLVYSTYLGGDGQDYASDIAIDAGGNVYLTGYTGSSNYPTAGAIQNTRSGLYSAFVTKLNAAGSAIDYSTYYGGTFGEFGTSIAVDPTGSAFVGGISSSPDFPRVGGVQTEYGGMLSDGFILKLNPAGDQVIFSSQVGGNGNDIVNDIAIDGNGAVYLTGGTFSTNYPAIGASQPTFRGGVFDAFLTRINGAGSAIAFSTYLGGGADDRANRIALDAQNNVYIGGTTASTNFPTSAAIQPTFGGGNSDSFVAKFGSGGTISYSTFFGGSGADLLNGIVVDSTGNAFLAGSTSSADLTQIQPVQPQYGGGDADAFAAKLRAAGDSFEYSTFIGGSGFDSAADVGIDQFGSAYILGVTNSANFLIANPFQANYAGGSSDLFLTKLAAAASVSGRVLTPSGQALRNATVSLITPQGQRRTATTSSFGLFSFDNVATGPGYTVTVASKRYRFTPRIIAISGNTAVGDIVGLE